MAGTRGDGERDQGSVLDAAYAQLAKYGPVVDGKPISLAGVARAIGTSRTNMYRRWPTSADLASDIAVIRSTPPSGWHAMVCVDDGGPFRAAVRRALADPTSSEGVLARAAVATRPGSTAHGRVAAWERRLLASLAARLRREWGPDVTGPWTDIAIAVVAVMDGMFLMCAQFTAHVGDPMPPALADEVADLAQRVVEFMLEHAEGPDTPIRDGEDEQEPEDDRENARLFQRVADALADGSLELAPDDGGRRVVDMGVLARSYGVSERSLYNRWPSADDLNAALYVESVQRTRDAFAQMVLDVFTSSASGSFTHTMPLIARMNSWFMDPDRFPEARVHLALVDVLSRQAVLDRVREPVEVGLQHADMQTAAIVHASGFRLLPGIRMRSYTMFVVGMGMGSHRTSALHPEILRRRLGYLGEDYPASGIGQTAMTRGCCELADPSMEGAPPATPPVPPSLGRSPVVD